MDRQTQSHVLVTLPPATENPSLSSHFEEIS